MRKTILTQGLSISTSVALLMSSLTGASGAALTSGAPAIPGFVRTFTPPSRLGTLTNYYQGESKQPVILIQDLHANYGVQKNIVGMLNYLQPKVTANGHPMILGMEGVSNEVDLTAVRQEPLKVRQEMGDYLLSEAEITGMEHFASLSPAPVRLVGIDKAEDYILHRDLFRHSLEARLKLAEKVGTLREAVTTAKGEATRTIKKIWMLEEAYQKGEMDLPELSQALGVKTLRNYGEAEAALYQRKVQIAETAGEKEVFLKNLVKADQDLALLGRLFRQQLTLEEVQFVASKLPEMLAIIHSFLPKENMEEWKDTVRAAIDFYAVALLRDKSLSERAFALTQNNPETPLVFVTGGFHTAGMADYFKSKKVSYVILAPVVTSHTTRDELLYIRRMMGDRLSNEEIAAAAAQKSAVTTMLGLEGRVADGTYVPTAATWKEASTNPTREVINWMTELYGIKGQLAPWNPGRSLAIEDVPGLRQAIDDYKRADSDSGWSHQSPIGGFGAKVAHHGGTATQADLAVSDRRDVLIKKFEELRSLLQSGRVFHDLTESEAGLLQMVASNDVTNAVLAGVNRLAVMAKNPKAPQEELARYVVRMENGKPEMHLENHVLQVQTYENFNDDSLKIHAGAAGTIGTAVSEAIKAYAAYQQAITDDPSLQPVVNGQHVDLSHKGASARELRAILNKQFDQGFDVEVRDNVAYVHVDMDPKEERRPVIIIPKNRVPLLGDKDFQVKKLRLVADMISEISHLLNPELDDKALEPQALAMLVMKAGTLEALQQIHLLPKIRFSVFAKTVAEAVTRFNTEHPDQKLTSEREFLRDNYVEQIFTTFWEAIEGKTTQYQEVDGTTRTVLASPAMEDAAMMPPFMDVRKAGILSSFAASLASLTQRQTLMGKRVLLGLKEGTATAISA